MSYSWISLPGFSHRATGPPGDGATGRQGEKANDGKLLPYSRIRPVAPSPCRPVPRLRLCSCFYLTQKAVLQPAVHRDDMAGRFGQPGRDEQEDGFGLIFRLYRRLRQCSLRVEVRQLFTQDFCRFVLTEIDRVLHERRDHAVARKHGAAFDSGGGRDGVDPRERRHLDGQLPNQMVRGGLARVIGETAFLGDDGVGAGGQHDGAGEPLPFENFVRLVGYQVCACDVDGESLLPEPVFDAARLVRRDEDARRHDDGVDAAVGDQRLLEHPRDAFAVRDVAAEAYARAAVADPGAGHAYALAVFGDDLVRRGFRRRLIQIDADDVRPFFDEPERRGLADAAPRADDGDDLAVEFLFGRQAAELGFFQLPVFDVERLLFVHRLVTVDGLCAAHDLDRAVVKLGRHARLALVLAPGDHADAGDQNHRRIRVAHRRRVGPLAAVVIGRVVLAIFHQPGDEQRFQRFEIARGRVPVHEKRFDLRAQEMIRA